MKTLTINVFVCRQVRDAMREVAGREPHVPEKD